MRNSYTFPGNDFDADDPFGRVGTVGRFAPHKRSRNPGDLVALMDRLVDRMEPPLSAYSYRSPYDRAYPGVRK